MFMIKSCIIENIYTHCDLIYNLKSYIQSECFTRPMFRRVNNDGYFINII